MPKATLKEQRAIERLKRELKNLVGVKTRFSPLGIEEYAVPAEQYNSLEEFTPGSRGFAEVKSNPPFIVYQQPYENDPEVSTHERIHAGQAFLKNQPTWSQIDKIFPDEFEGTSGMPQFEKPAYAFDTVYPADKFNAETQQKYKNRPNILKSLLDTVSQVRAKEQNKFNEYIDLMNILNPGQAQPLEAAMPESLIREYIKSHAKPHRPRYRIPEGLLNSGK